MLNGVIFVSPEQILGKKIIGSYGRYPVLRFALWSIKFMELQSKWNSRKFAVKSLLHSNWCVCIQKNDNGRVGEER